jgi:3-methyladenine DNA glycosylase AlkC
MDISNRKAPRTLKDLKEDIRTQLNLGNTASLNLIEWLAIDPLTLLTNILHSCQRTHYIPEITTRLEQLKKRTVNTVNETIGITLLQLCQKHRDTSLHSFLSTHVADMARCWAAYMTGLEESPLSQKMAAIKLFAADTHFGVREIAWMAVRPSITRELSGSIDILSQWTTDTDAHVRRFACEALRPRGVWCAHIDALKTAPQLALPVLEPLQADPARYVQDSVGNWLNDASKTQPDFVRNLCAEWEQKSPVKATQYIIKKALRTLNKA